MKNSQGYLTLTFFIVFDRKTVSVKQCAILRGFWHSWLYTATMSSKRAVIALGTSRGMVGSLKTFFDKKLLNMFLTIWVGPKMKKICPPVKGLTTDSFKAPQQRNSVLTY